VFLLFLQGLASVDWTNRSVPSQRGLRKSRMIFSPSEREMKKCNCFCIMLAITSRVGGTGANHLPRGERGKRYHTNGISGDDNGNGSNVEDGLMGLGTSCRRFTFRSSVLRDSRGKKGEKSGGNESLGGEPYSCRALAIGSMVCREGGLKAKGEGKPQTTG